MVYLKAIFIFLALAVLLSRLWIVMLMLKTLGDHSDHQGESKMLKIDQDGVVRPPE